MPPKKSRKAKPKPHHHHESISSEEVVHLEAQADSHERSERAWLSMTATEEEDDGGWHHVEEHLLVKSHQQDRSPTRWKHFGK